MNYQRNRLRGLRGAMLWRTLGLALAGGVLGSTMGSPAMVCAQQPVATTPLVFDGVTVVDVEQGRLLPDQRVVIVGTRIRTMGNLQAVQVPAGARVIDARGKYLIPGLWDMHVHPRRLVSLFYPLFIATGVTGIRDPNSPVPLDTLNLWRREILAGTRVGPPRQILSGLAIDADKWEGNKCKRTKLNYCVADTADARHLIDSLKAAGADMIKPYATIRETYFVMAAEARRVGIPFGGHIGDGVTALEAADSGVSITDHMVQIDGWVDDYCMMDADTKATVERCQQLTEHFKQHGTWAVPTLITTGTESLKYGKPFYERYVERTRAFWAGALLHGNWLRDSASVGTPSHPDSSGAMRIIQRFGLPLLAGTDVPAFMDSLHMGDLKPIWNLFTSTHQAGFNVSAGFSLHAELAMYVAEGLTPLAALQTATLNPAKFLHATDSLGTVAPNKLADLVLLDANPLADITNTTTICAVVANGRYYDRATLDSILVKVQKGGQ